MDAKEFGRKYGKSEAERVSQAAGTTYSYFIQIAGGHSLPSPRLARALERASGGRMTRLSLRPDIYGDAA